MKVLKFGSLSLASFAVTFILLGGFAKEAQTEEKAPSARTSAAVEHSTDLKMMMACARACSDCQRACDSCSTHCAHMLHEGKKPHFVSLTHCQDCATVCSAASEIVARGGPFSNMICTACADACGRCAKECEKFLDDAHMKECAQECRKCEKACRDMVKSA